MFEQIVVTEGKFDRELLEKVLPVEIAAKTLIVEGMGPSSALSLARSYYVQGKRVLIVLDSNTVDEESILERKAFVESALQMLGSGAEAKVVLGVPGLDALLFTDKDFVEGYFSKKVTENDMEWYRKIPSCAIEKLANGSFTGDHGAVKLKMLETMNLIVVNKISKAPVIEEMIAFLK